MDIQDLFYSCKTGDLQRLQYLIETKDVDFNVRDEWNSTPLYYACLCGHRKTVEYLLEKGATCEANTFEGEHCLYGALTDDIRNMLRNHNVVSHTIRRAPFEEFLRRLHESRLYSDVILSVHGKRIPAHRCILSTRLEIFAKMFNNKWVDKDVVEINHSMISATVFECIIQYIYTGRVELPLDLIDDCSLLARHLGMATLVKAIDSVFKAALSWQSSKLGVKITTLVVDTPELSSNLKFDMYQLAEKCFPPKMCSWVSGELPFESDYMSYGYPDIHYIVEGDTFKCHKTFFCYRSDYFKALLEDHFGENQCYGDIPVISLHNITSEVFVQVLYYLYSETCYVSQDIAEDLLLSADMFLLPGLKNQCASAMMKYMDLSNVIRLIRTARLFNLHRLETSCNEFIANNLSRVIMQEDFRQLVLEDSEKIMDREETDTIDILDEVRVFITNFISYSEVPEANLKLRLIDDMLEELGLDA